MMSNEHLSLDFYIALELSFHYLLEWQIETIMYSPIKYSYPVLHMYNLKIATAFLHLFIFNYY